VHKADLHAFGYMPDSDYVRAEEREIRPKAYITGALAVSSNQSKLKPR
jgi:hypothetical protein